MLGLSPRLPWASEAVPPARVTVGLGPLPVIGLLMMPAVNAGLTVDAPAVLETRVASLKKGWLKMVLVLNGLFSGRVESFAGRVYSLIRSWRLTKLRRMSSAFKFL